MHTPTIALGARLTAVKLKDQAGEDIGKVIEWLMDVEEGRVLYVVAQFHGEQVYHALPWGVMQADLEAGGYVLDADKVKSYNLQVDRDSMNELVTDKDFLHRLYDAYQLPKYWQDNRTAASQPAQDTEGTAGKEAAQAGEGKGYGG